MANAGRASMTPHFLDLYVIPTGIETLHNGGDPLAANPADPLHIHELPASLVVSIFRQPGLLAKRLEGGTPILRFLLGLHLLSYRSI